MILSVAPLPPSLPPSQDVVVKAVISAEGNANAIARNQLKLLHYLSSCFELFGVDILLDRNLHPWLLEFNTGPALHTPSLVDKEVKTAVVSDLLHLIGIQATLGKGRFSVGLTKRTGETQGKEPNATM